LEPRLGNGWTDDTIGDLTGTIAIVTGANSGLGFVTAAQPAAHGGRPTGAPAAD
jgi:hypothetical protein